MRDNIKPVLKWAGGKRQLIDIIKENIPCNIEKSTYYEPFIGGGAVLFELQPKKAVINDVNDELINLYNIIKDDVELLIEDLKKHENTPEYFYSIRELDRKKDKYENLSNIEKASRIVYLNKTCFNGLFRVNKAGEFNSPFGKYKNPNIVDETALRAVSKYFNKADIKILNGDFEEILKGVEKDDFVYLDPPYDVENGELNFTSYTSSGFNRDTQIRLKKLCDKLDKKGVKFLLSNSATDFIKDLYKDYNIKIVKAKRAINCNKNKRGKVEEVLIKNY